MSIRYHAESDTFWLPKPDRLAEAQLDHDHIRIPGELRWKNKKLGVLAKIAAITESTTSGHAPDEVVAMRKLSCLGGNGAPPCPALLRDGSNSFCGACGCGKWLLASLDGVVPKLRWAKLNCPLRRPGFSNS